MRYTWILLDADDTLFDYDRAESVALERAFLEMEIGFESRYLPEYRRINGEIWREFERGAIAQADLKSERFRRLFEALGLDADPAAFSAVYLSKLAEGHFLIDGAEEVVKELRGSVGLLLITNGLAGVQRPRLAASAIRGCFDGVVISEEIGVSKPDGRIFNHAFELMGGPPKDHVLMVGDSLTSDMRGGSDYGIDTCWVNPTGKPRPEGIRITYEIARIAELPQIIGGLQRPVGTL